MDDLTFRADIVSEGSAKNMRITLPPKVAKQLTTPGWVKLQLKDDAPFYGFARRPPSRACTATMTLPPWRFPQLKIGMTIEACISDAAPDRAQPGAPDDARFDWLRFILGTLTVRVAGLPNDLKLESDYFVTELDGVLSIHSRYAEPFTLLRYPDESTLYWLFGFFQAEGSKSDKAPDWSLANTNVELLRETRDALEKLGIARDRQYIEVLHAKGTDAEEANAHFAPLGLRIAATRHFTSAVNVRPLGVFHVNRSLVFLRMLRGVLVQLFAGDAFPSQDAAERFALGWLDGDGQMLEMGTNTALRLAGLEDEHRVVRTALQQAFGWEKGANYQNNKVGTHLTLRGAELLQLIDANAFRFSMNRARLLVGFAMHTAGLRALATRPAPFPQDGQEGFGVFVRWGLLDRDADGYRLSPQGEAICAGYARHEEKIERARRLLAAAPKGKGVFYSEED